MAILGAFSNGVNAIRKARADLEPDILDHQINITDVLFSIAGFSGLTCTDIVFDPQEEFGEVCEPPTECEADLLADSNGDGVIDSSDNDVEDSTAMVFVYNVDDDDFSGFLDIDEAPLIGEDDLAELKLLAPMCDPADPSAATWLLSWPLTTVNVWLSPDKSDVTSGGPLVSDVEYPWPMPTSVWLEASEPIENMQMSLTVSSFVGSEATPDTVLVTSECPAVTLATAPGVCYANIQTDSNNDLKINNCDEIVENDSPGVIVYINDDDDNENGTLDFDESPVVGENDLQEVRLSTSCVPVDENLAWWSVSWPVSNPEVLQVWLESDKSDGNGQAGTPLVNAEQNAWPPPATVWLESHSEWIDKELTLTVFDGNGASAASNQGVGEVTSLQSSSKNAITVGLRVVMLVESGADLEDATIPASTFGTKITKTQIKELVSEAIALEGVLYKGIRLDIVFPDPPESDVWVLESPCLIAASVPACFGVMGAVQNPRFQDADWFAAN